MTTTVVASLATPPTEEATDLLIAQLPGLSASAGPDDYGRLGVTFTLDTDEIVDAIQQAIQLLAAYDVRGLEAIPTDDFDLRSSGGLEMSVSEAARELGISRQAVLKRIQAGTMPASKVGQTYVLPRFAVLQHR